MMVNSISFKAFNIETLKNENLLIESKINDGVLESGKHFIIQNGTYHSKEHQVTFEYECMLELNGSSINWGTSVDLWKNKGNHIVLALCQEFSQSVVRWDQNQ